MAGLLDTQTPQLFSSQASFHDQASHFNSTVNQAEQSAVAAQAIHKGDSSMAFQQAHAQFVEAAQKLNVLLHSAGENIGDAGTTYQTQDSLGASDIAHAAAAMPTTLPTLA